jgi:hypothetical protein
MAQEDKKLIRAEDREYRYCEIGEFGADETIRDLALAIGDYLAVIAPREKVDQAMAILAEPLEGTCSFTMDKPTDWRELVKDAWGAGYTEWPIGALLFQMGAYAEYGVLMNGPADPEERRTRLQTAIADLVRFHERSPLSHWGIRPDNDLQRLVLLAANRWALDNGNPVDPAALAIFGGVSDGRIRNMMSGQNRTFSSVEGRIPAQEALAWLSTREEFWNSVWETTEQPEYGVKRDAPIEHAVFLPVARDGSVFHPGEIRGSNYTIGPKGDEKQIEDFEEALEALQRMPTPYWRRPNDKGNWGIVAGVEWARFDIVELDVIARMPGYRLPDDRRA